MIYLDYAANTSVDEKVLEVYVDATKKFIANPNSNHYLGKLARREIENTSIKFGLIFDCDKEGIIYTSGASEANNLVIKGISDRYKDVGNKIIISALEHSSVVAPCNYLASKGYDVSVIPVNEEGIIDLDILENEIDDKTILVSICYVDSELGTIQPIEKVANIIKKYPNVIFHTDATQAIGKTIVDFQGVDFITFAPHKFFGLNGMGVLVNRNNLKMTPLIHGGKSTTIFRSGTPIPADVIATLKAFELATDNLFDRSKRVAMLKQMIIDDLKDNEHIHINSPKNSVPNILNISLIDKNKQEILKGLEENGIYISSGAACSLDNVPSKSVLAITKDNHLATNTLRISISHLTTKEEIKKFLEVLNALLKK
ncbi:MAG: cysteine desulfurase [Mollicutes bacterium]|nr:cysteine desulfurase [Mollicutes bacterium]